jgi:pyruvate-formate lyase-activating enzyme
MNDFVVQEHVCNLRCSYCLNFENEHLKDGKPWQPLEQIDLREGSAGWERARRVLDRCRAIGEAPILKLSGGEIFAIGGALEFLEAVAPDWDRVQVLTNATLLSEPTIERLARLPHLNLCCSVDGHTPELNALRTTKPVWAQRILDGTRRAMQAGIPVEIYTVVTSQNATALYEFACYLASEKASADVRYFPFPVRGDAAVAAGAVESPVAGLQKILDNYDALGAVLPPAPYFERLLAFYQTGIRGFRCHIPLTHVQTFDDGVVAACSNCWASQLGRVTEESNVFAQVGEAGIHRVFLKEPPRFPFCRGCFTPFDVVNVYLDGDCSLESMTQMDLFSSPKVIERLVMLRAMADSGARKALWSDA